MSPETVLECIWSHKQEQEQTPVVCLFVFFKRKHRRFVYWPLHTHEQMRVFTVHPCKLSSTFNTGGTESAQSVTKHTATYWLQHQVVQSQHTFFFCFVFTYLPPQRLESFGPFIWANYKNHPLKKQTNKKSKKQNNKRPDEEEQHMWPPPSSKQDGFLQFILLKSLVSCCHLHDRRCLECSRP